MSTESTAAGRCDQGTEIVVAAVTLHSGEPVDLKLTLCQATFRVIVFLDDQTLVDEEATRDEVRLTLPRLGPGLHALSWAYLPAGASWKVLSEVFINGIVRFRQRKGHTSNIPAPHTFLLLEVI